MCPSTDFGCVYPYNSVTMCCLLRTHFGITVLVIVTLYILLTVFFQYYLSAILMCLWSHSQFHMKPVYLFSVSP
jgi:hypothetical protein